MFAVLNMHYWSYVIIGWLGVYAVIALWFYASRPIKDPVAHTLVDDVDKKDVDGKVKIDE